MKSRVTPSSLLTCETKSSCIRIAILSGLRTRSASVSLLFALATENAPKLIVISTDAIRNVETFLNILPPQNRRDISPVVCFQLLVWAVLGCFDQREGCAKSARWHGRPTREITRKMRVPQSNRITDRRTTIV